jgi:hypothetical protein
LSLVLRLNCPVRLPVVVVGVVFSIKDVLPSTA